MLIARCKSLNSGSGFPLSFLIIHLFLHAPLVYQSRTLMARNSACSKSLHSAPSMLPELPGFFLGNRQLTCFPQLKAEAKWNSNPGTPTTLWWHRNLNHILVALEPQQHSGGIGTTTTLWWHWIVCFVPETALDISNSSIL